MITHGQDHLSALVGRGRIEPACGFGVFFDALALLVKAAEPEFELRGVVTACAVEPFLEELRELIPTLETGLLLLTKRQHHKQ